MIESKIDQQILTGQTTQELQALIPIDQLYPGSQPQTNCHTRQQPTRENKLQGQLFD